MPASINDLIIKQGDGTQPIPTQLTAEKAVAATTASLAAATGWDTTTAKHVRMYKTTVINGQTVPDQSTISYYKATLSGTTLSNLTLIWSATGTDQKYDAGDTVDLSITSGYIDDLVEHLLVEHNQDGTHNTSVVATLTATQTLTNKTLSSPTISGAVIVNANLSTSAGELGAAWTSYTPTITATSGTFTSVTGSGAYKKIGKTVHIWVNAAITTAGTASGDIIFSFPSGVTPVVSRSLGVARETQLTGAYGFCRFETSYGTMCKVDLSSFIASGRTVLCSGTYETA